MSERKAYLLLSLLSLIVMAMAIMVGFVIPIHGVLLWIPFGLAAVAALVTWTSFFYGLKRSNRFIEGDIIEVLLEILFKT